jgi:multiple sugar transport system substrate-binding protein
MKRRASLVLAGLAVAASLVAATTAQGGPNSHKTSQISMLVSDYMFNSVPLGTTYYNHLTKEWNAKYPGVKLKIIRIGGTDVDEANKLSLLFRSPSQTPDVVVIETPNVTQYAGSGYLATLDSEVGSHASAPFWSSFPPNIRNLTRVSGHTYGISAGNNDQALLYNKAMLRKAGVKVPWKPHSWADIIAAAKKVKQHDRGVIPFWVGAGVAAGPFNVLQGSGNLLYGTKTPKMFDDKTGKWVVDSSGLRATLDFYKSIYGAGLGASTSELFKPTSVGRPPTLMQQKKLAITLASNWMPSIWVDPKSGSTWKTAGKEVGISPIPTENGQAPGAASTIGGWAFSISKASKNTTMDWNLIKMNMENANLLKIALGSGFVPPNPKVGHQKQFINYARPFQAAFNDYAKFGTPLPSDPNFPVYARALNTATGDIAQHPSNSVASEIKSIHDAVSQELGGDKVETLP